MKKLLLGLTLLVSTPLCQANKPVYLDCGLLSLVDGTEFIGIAEIFSFAGNIIGLINGLHLKTALQLQKTYDLNLPEPLEEYANDNDRVGLVWYKDSYTTVKEMLKIEESNPSDPELTRALVHACNHFEKFSEDYVEEIKAAKKIMVKIITNWSELRDRPDSLLLTWSQVDENDRDSLYRTMTSFDVFDTFLNDLLLFLKDLVQNCPKSHKMYREQQKKIQS